MEETDQNKLITDLLPLVSGKRDIADIKKFVSDHLQQITAALPKEEIPFYYSMEQARAIYHDAQSIGMDVSSLKRMEIDGNRRKAEIDPAYEKAFRSLYRRIEKEHFQPATTTAPAPAPAPAPKDVPTDTSTESGSIDISSFCDTRPKTNKPLPPEIPQDEIIINHVPTKYEKTPVWERDENSTEYVRQTRLLLCAESYSDDTGNAQVFATECNGWLKYNTAPGINDKERWMFWNGTAWMQDLSNAKTLRAAKVVSATLSAELGKLFNDLSDDAAIKRQYNIFSNHVRYSKSLASQKRMIESSITENGMSMNFDEVWQKGRYLLSCKNGIFDRLSGTFYYCDTDAEKIQELRDTCFPTQYVDLTYNPNAKAPLFEDYIEKIHTDNTTPDLSPEEVIRRRDESIPVHKRIYGYGLIPKNTEKIGIWNLGAKRNTGKSTDGEIFCGIFPTIATMGNSAELFSNPGEHPHPTIRYGLKFCYLFLQETESTDEDVRPNERNVLSTQTQKALIDNTSTMAFRGMHENLLRPLPICCLPIMASNKPPRFENGIDTAIRDRIYVIPHSHVFAGEEIDTHFVDKVVEQESDAIFSLLINWCMEYIDALKESEGNTGLLKAPDFWLQAKEDALVSGVYGSFLLDRYEMADTERSEENLIYKDEIERDLLQYARHKDRTDEIATTIKKTKIPKFDKNGNPEIDAYGDVIYDAIFDTEVLTKESKKKLTDALLIVFNVQYESPRKMKQRVYLVPKKSDQRKQFEQQSVETVSEKKTSW